MIDATRFEIDVLDAMELLKAAIQRITDERDELERKNEKLLRHYEALLRSLDDRIEAAITAERKDGAARVIAVTKAEQVRIMIELSKRYAPEYAEAEAVALKLKEKSAPYPTNQSSE